MLPYYTCGICNKSHFLALSFKLTFSVLLTSPWGILFQPVSRGGLRWPFPASVSIVSTAVTSDHCVCVCRSPRRCTCSATPRAGGTNRLCETVAASREGNSRMRKWCVSRTHPTRSKHVSCKKTKRRCGRLLWHGHYYCLCVPLYTASALLLALCDYKWALKCTQLGVSASAGGGGGGDITPLSPFCFCHEAPFHGKAAH